VHLSGSAEAPQKAASPNPPAAGVWATLHGCIFNPDLSAQNLSLSRAKEEAQGPQSLCWSQALLPLLKWDLRMSSMCTSRVRGTSC